MESWDTDLGIWQKGKLSMAFYRHFAW